MVIMQPAIQENIRAAEFDPQTIQKIFRLLCANSGVDFSKYKSGTINRKLQRCMEDCGIHDPEEYYYQLLDNQTEIRKLFHSFLIPLTGFFRNSKLFPIIEKEILPLILPHALKRGTIRIWVPGCSTGEEVYSIGICLAEKLDLLANHIDVKIFGTDVNEEAIEESRKGLYSVQRLKGVSKQRLRKFFVKVDGGYRIGNFIRSFCIFAHHNLLKDPPFNHLDIISCQNVLIYLTIEAQEPILRMFYFALNPEGFFILGDSEAIPTYRRGFRKWRREYPIYVPDHQ